VPVLGLVIVLKGLVEFAALLIVGQAAVYLLSFGRHERNVVYRFMRLLTSPVVRLARWLSPGVIVGRHVPAVALFMLFAIWVFLTFMKFHLQLSAQA
jgi:hypothetical protein